MYVDGGGTVDIEEICIVHDSDKEAMMKILDADGNKEVDPAEWQNYLYLKKQEKGKKKFGFFLNYLEQEVPKNLGKIHAAREEKAPAASSSAANVSSPAPASGA